MLVLLLRHGIAEPHGTRPDELRELTDEGRRKTKEIAAAISSIFPVAERIISSPLRRCVETAQFVQKAYDGELAVMVDGSLRPEADSGEAVRMIRGAGYEKLIVVGHEPNLTETMLELTNMRAEAGIELKKGGCYLVRVDDSGGGTLEWILPPRVLRATL
jgi:phosphohistidine phosphatase